MADTLRSRLRKLFSTNIIITNQGGGKLKIADPNQIQSAVRQGFVDRYTKLYSSMAGGTGRAQQLFMAAQRLALFKDYETMDADSIISSALNIYADESTMKSDYGNVLEIYSESDNIRDILHNLFYDVLNIEFNLWPWTRNMCKYGDFYLYLNIMEKFGITNTIPISAYDVVRVEGEDPENPDEVGFEIAGGDNRHTQRQYRKQTYEEYEIAHFRLNSDSNFMPYGKSMIEGARKTWKQVVLMEDAMLIQRIMRAPERRIFKIDIGNIAPAEVEPYMKRIIDKMKKAPVMNEQGEYNLKYNMQNITEDFFLPVRGGDSGTEIETLSGLQYDAIEDIEYLKNRMMAALVIPKAFLGYEEGLGCVVPETKIPLLNGETKTVQEIIDDYENGITHYTYTLNTDNNKMVPGEIEWAGFTSRNANLVRVNLDNDKFIDCTPNHKFLMRDGSWIEAQNLQESQSLMPLYLDEDRLGYTTIYHPGIEQYQSTHRMVAEYYDMIYQGSGRVVHHTDFNKKNNNPENFDCSMTFWEHRDYHGKLIAETLNSPENIAKRVKSQKESNHFVIAGRKGGLKSVDKLAEYARTHVPWNKGKLLGKFKLCVECGDEFYTEPHVKNQQCCSIDCSTKYFVGKRRYNTKFIVEVDVLKNVAKDCSSLKELECKLGNIDRNTLNRIFEYNTIDKVDFIFNNMPLALQNKHFMQNYRQYEKQYLNHVVRSIEFLTETKDTCDLTIKKYHNFATAAGVIIHNSKATLAAEDVRFGRTIERIQRTLVSELTKIAIVHLVAQGFEEKDLLNFELALTNPSIIYEQEQLEKWNARIDFANSLKDSDLVDSDWIYENVFKFTEDEKQRARLGVIQDKKRTFRYEQIQQEGNDPVKSHEAIGTPGTMDDDSEEGVGAGRPEEANHFGKDGSARGRDPVGAHDMKKAASGNRKYGKSLALAHYANLKNSMIKFTSKEDKKLITEANDVVEEYLSEISSSEKS